MSKHAHVINTGVLGISGIHTKRKFRVSYGRVKQDDMYFINVYLSGDEHPIIEMSSPKHPVGELISLGMIVGLPMQVLEKMSKLQDI